MPNNDDRMPFNVCTPDNNGMPANAGMPVSALLFR